MNYLLGIETATDACSCALWCEGEITERFEIAPRRQAERVLPMIDELLQEKQLTLADMQAIAFGQGPGSFMGTRLAASVALGLAFGVDIPVIPISTLQALAQRAYVQYQFDQVAAAWDARMQEMYWGCYRVDADGIMQPLRHDELSAPAAVRLPDGHWHCVGNAWQVYQAKWLAEPVHDLLYPSAAMVVLLATKLGKSQARAQKFHLSYLRQQVAHSAAEKS